ncbi:MAG: hypothetical protein AMK72_05565 [Planctomycetes bacterium SM23_25]|nr:MAG: hypothetical protein AMK72_05565 [Planctomycetes bacterium SM23_25]
MRCFKLLLMGGIVLALSMPALGITFNQPWNGPLVMHVTNWDMGTIWTGVPGTYCPATVPPLGRIAPPGAIGGEDGWGLVRIDTIHKGMATGPNTIIMDPVDPAPLWVHGQDGRELAGIFWGLTDVNVQIGAASFTTESVGMQFEIWDQPVTSFNGGVPGSAGRSLVNPNQYLTVGTPGGVVGASLWVSGASSPGFVGALCPMGPDVEFVSTFNPNLAVGKLAGSANVYFDLTGGDWGPLPTPTGMTMDTNFFQGTDIAGNPEDADWYLQITAYSNNPANVPGGFDWTATSSDPITTEVIPEPITMAGMLLGIGCLGRYVRRRR